MFVAQRLLSQSDMQSPIIPPVMGYLLSYAPGIRLHDQEYGSQSTVILKYFMRLSSKRIYVAIEFRSRLYVQL
jgi:hypothetical protein